MRKLLIIPLLVGAFFLGAYQKTETPIVSSTNEPTYLTLVNQLRTEPLAESQELNRSALRKANDMKDRHYYAHENGSPFYQFIVEEKPGLRKMGENLAECHISAKQTVGHWAESPTHLQNIQDPEFTLFGSATVWDGKCLITVNHFGT